MKDKTKKLLQAWKEGTPPPKEDLLVFNSKIDIGSHNKNFFIQGYIEWNEENYSYTFTFTKHLKGPASKVTSDYVVYEPIDFYEVVSSITELGIKNTNIIGIFNTNYPRHTPQPSLLQRNVHLIAGDPNLIH